MSSVQVLGAMIGGLFATGLLLVGDRVATRRRTSLSVRVYPYLRDMPLDEGTGSATSEPTSAVSGVFGPILGSAANAVERLLGGAASVRRRLVRANLGLSLHEFRIEQVLWGLVAFAIAAVPASVASLREPTHAVELLIGCLLAFAFGVLLRENRLTSQVRARERRILEEFPTVAELLALAVAAGEGPVAALDRVVRRSHGELSSDLTRVLAEIRTGAPVARAFDELALNSGLPAVSRFAEGLAIAVERGTPLADVLHAQAGDVREAGRRELIESGARREVLMMVPVNMR